MYLPAHRHHENKPDVAMISDAMLQNEAIVDDGRQMRSRRHRYIGWRYCSPNPEHLYCRRGSFHCRGFRHSLRRSESAEAGFAVEIIQHSV